MKSRRRLVVTGAGGFIGMRLVQIALQDGWEVTALLRDPKKISHLNCSQLRVERWNIGESVLSQDLLLGADALCHLAAFVPPDYADPVHAAECFRVNALGTLELSLRASEAKVGRFVFFSSAQIYAPTRGAVSEEALVYPAFRAPFYLSSKLTAEIFVQHQSISKALPLTILRLASVYGSGMSRKGMISEFIQRISDGQAIDVLNGGTYSIDFIHVNDVTRAALTAIEEEADGLFNIGSGQARTSLEVANILVELMGADKKLINVHPYDNQSSAGFSALDVQKAKIAFGFSPIRLEDGLKQTLRE